MSHRREWPTTVLRGYETLPLLASPYKGVEVRTDGEQQGIV